MPITKNTDWSKGSMFKRRMCLVASSGNAEKREDSTMDTGLGGEAMKQDCYKCVHMGEYESIATPVIVRICEGDGWGEENEDGSFDLVEVTNFDPKDCVMFKEVKP